MKTVLGLFVSLYLISATPAVAAAKTYQVTGPVLELTDTLITIQKGSEKWQIDRDAATKVEGELKVGAKVTVEYTMKAATIAAKTDKSKKAGK